MKVIENRDNPDGRWMVTLVSEDEREMEILERLRDRRAYAAYLTTHTHDPATGKISSVALDLVADITVTCTQCAGLGRVRRPWPRDE